MRKIDSNFNTQMPALLVRQSCILINFTYIRALIKADLILLFDAVGSTDSYQQSLFMYDLEDRLRQTCSGGLPFEFRALESILMSVVASLGKEFETIKSVVSGVLVELEEQVDRTKLKDLLQLSMRLSSFEQKISSIRESITEVLDQGGF